MAKVRTQTGGFYYAKYQLKRAILENALQTNLTTEDHETALEFFGGCAFCGINPAPRKDHLVAVFNRGDFIPCNVVPACQQCDDSKGQTEYHEWMRHSHSPRSLKARGFSDKTEAELFGEDYTRYQDLLIRMDELCEEAKMLASRARQKGVKPRSTMIP